MEKTVKIDGMMCGHCEAICPQGAIKITGFENDACGNGTGEWRNTQVNGGSGSCSINEDLQYVKFGNIMVKT